MRHRAPPQLPTTLCFIVLGILRLCDLQSTLLYLPTSHEYLPMLHHFLSAPLPFSVAISDSVSSPTVSHCFDLNLKLETTPPWNKEVKMPAIWFTKFSQLLRNSTNTFKELRKVVLG